MQAIRAWLTAHPREAPGLMARNGSYVFFRFVDGDGPIGAQGVPLLPGRSIAVDPGFVPYGVPVWLDTTDPLDEPNTAAPPGRGARHWRGDQGPDPRRSVLGIRRRRRRRRRPDEAARPLVPPVAEGCRGGQLELDRAGAEIGRERGCESLACQAR